MPPNDPLLSQLYGDKALSKTEVQTNVSVGKMRQDSVHIFLLFLSYCDLILMSSGILHIKVSLLLDEDVDGC